MAKDGGDEGPAICVIDVGGPKNLGWAVISAGGEDPATFDDLMELLPGLARSQGLWLGFEAPLFLPRAEDWRTFTRARNGDGARAWSAGAGASVATIGLALVLLVLGKLRAALPEADVTLDHARPIGAGRILVFEAFVSGAAKRRTHHQDAMQAALACRRMRALPEVLSAVTAERPFSLAGAALLATGWSSDLGLLAAPCLVVRPGSAPA